MECFWHHHFCLLIKILNLAFPFCSWTIASIISLAYFVNSTIHHDYDLNCYPKLVEVTIVWMNKWILLQLLWQCYDSYLMVVFASSFIMASQTIYWFCFAIIVIKINYFLTSILSIASVSLDLSPSASYYSLLTWMTALSVNCQLVWEDEWRES